MHPPSQKEDKLDNECEQEIFKDQLAREMQKPKISRINKLMDTTHNTRRVWIENTVTPSVSEVFEEYPSLNHGKLVSLWILF